MNAARLRMIIERLTDDIEFQYNEIWGSICPFSHTNISVSYGDAERTFNSVDSLFNDPFIDEMPLKDICHKFII